MHIYEKEFDFVIHRAKSLERRARAVVFFLTNIH